MSSKLPFKKNEDLSHCNYTYAAIDETARAATIDHPGLSNLNLGIGPDLICSRQTGGGKVSYGEGNKIIQLANETFGFNGWSTTIRQFTIDYCEVDDKKRVDMSASAVIRVTLRDGTHREDIGCGNCSNVNGRGAAIEKVRKECVTDGIKRALRQFGRLFMSAYDNNHMAEVTKRYKSVRPPIEINDLYQGKAVIALKKSAAAAQGANNTSNNQAARNNNNNHESNNDVPFPIDGPIPAKRIPSSPPPRAPVDHIEAAAELSQDLLRSDDFDALDALMIERREAEHDTKKPETQPPINEEEYNPINESNEKELLTFVSGSQAEVQQNLEQASKFDVNTPDKFQFKKSAPIKRKILQDSRNNSPLSQSKVIENANVSASMTAMSNNDNNAVNSNKLEVTSSATRANPQDFAKPLKVLPTTPLVKKRPLNDRGANAVNTPVGGGGAAAAESDSDSKRQRVSPE